LIASVSESCKGIFGLRKAVSKYQPSIEESLNDPYFNQEFKELVTDLCQNWVDKMKLKKEFNFKKHQSKFFSKSSRSHNPGRLTIEVQTSNLLKNSQL
jgi:hypothetical protein